MLIPSVAPKNGPLINARIPFLALATLIIFLILTLGIASVVQRSVTVAAETRFNAIGQSTSEKLMQRMQAYEQILKGGVALFSTSDTINREQWHRYVRDIKVEANFPGIQGIGFAEYIPPSGLDAHVARVRGEGFPDYQVRPGQPRAEYTSIVWLEPFNSRNKRAFGFDMFSEPVRRQAMSAARDQGVAVLSGRVKLLQETTTDVQPGVLLYQPVYVSADEPVGVSARRAALRGYVYAPFRMNDLMRGILGGYNDSVDLRVYDGNELLFSQLAPPPLQQTGKSRVPTASANHGKPLFTNAHTLTLYGRQWTLQTRSTRAFERSTLVYVPHLVLLCGLVISVLFSCLVWTLFSRRENALALASDMTATLREREAFISAVVDHAADGIVTLDGDSNILSLNKAAERIFGWPNDAVAGRNVALLFPLPSGPVLMDDYMIGGATRVVEGQRRDGQRFFLELAVSEIRVGKRRAFASIVRDISERRQAEESLRRSEERFDLAFLASNDGLWDWSIEDGRIYYSPSWCTMLGYDPKQVAHTLQFWEEIVHPEDKPGVMEAIAAYHRGELSSFRHEHRLRRKDGSYMWILSRAFAQRDEQGKVYRMVGINTDIDQGKHIEQMKNQFISIVSHELRTPVTSIYGSIMLLKSKTVAQSETERTLLEMALRNATNLLTLINDLLDMDKIQSGKLQMQMMPVALRQLLKDSCECNQGYAEQYGVIFALEQCPAELWVLGDETRLQQVMSNLLSNAAKFSPPGSRVTISLGRDGEQARISVTDTGEGIPYAFRNRIFSKFAQADSSSSRPRNGSGLGLNISRAIIEALGGAITFDTMEGRGTTFHVHLPLIAPPAP